MNENKTGLKFDFATIALDDAYTAFWHRCNAKNVSQKTLALYEFTAGKFITWLKENGINAPELVTARHVTGYLSALRDLNKASDNTLHAHARAIRTMLIYWNESGYAPTRIKFDMPRVGDVNHQVLSFDELGKLIKAAINPRDKAIVALMVDTGARRQEVCNLNWENIDLKTGAVHIIRGKGRKNRWVGISPETIKYILQYRRAKKLDVSPENPVFLSRSGERIAGSAILQLFRRLSKRAGFPVHPHALRHTYATNANTEGLSIYDIQKTMGHADTKTTDRYIKSLPSKIVEKQVAVSPMMKLSKRRK